MCDPGEWDHDELFSKPASDGPARDPWDNLPPHLREALREALEGLRDAFEDHVHPFSPALQAVWDVTDQIEAFLLAHPEETFGHSE